MLNEEWILRQGRELTDTACMDALRWQGQACDPQSFLQEYRQTYQQEVQDIHDFLAIRMEFLKSEWLEEA